MSLKEIFSALKIQWDPALLSFYFNRLTWFSLHTHHHLHELLVLFEGEVDRGVNFSLMGVLGASRPLTPSSRGTWWERERCDVCADTCDEQESRVWLTCVSSHTPTSNLCKISTTASFIVTWAKRMPMQFLGPIPKGMNVYGSMDSLLSWVNLNAQQIKAHRDIRLQEQEFVKCVCGDLSGLKESGSLQCSGSLWRTYVGIITTISLGMMSPLISTVFLQTRSSRAAGGNSRRDSFRAASR